MDGQGPEHREAGLDQPGLRGSRIGDVRCRGYAEQGAELGFGGHGGGVGAERHVQPAPSRGEFGLGLGEQHAGERAHGLPDPVRPGPCRNWSNFPVTNQPPAAVTTGRSWSIEPALADP